MSQDRLSSLRALSIENDIAENLDFSTLFKDFGDKKARMINFKKLMTYHINIIAL